MKPLTVSGSGGQYHLQFLSLAGLEEAAEGPGGGVVQSNLGLNSSYKAGGATVGEAVAVSAFGAFGVEKRDAAEEEALADAFCCPLASRPGATDDDELVDFGLELELQLCGRQLPTSALYQTKEVADTFDDLAVDVEGDAACSSERFDRESDGDLDGSSSHPHVDAFAAVVAGADEVIDAGCVDTVEPGESLLDFMWQRWRVVHVQ